MNLEVIRVNIDCVLLSSQLVANVVDFDIIDSAINVGIQSSYYHC